MRLETWHSEDEKRKWKVVKLDDFKELPGHIIAACEATGEAVMQVRNPEGEGTVNKEFSCGAGGLRIVGR